MIGPIEVVVRGFEWVDARIAPESSAREIETFEDVEETDA